MDRAQRRYYSERGFPDEHLFCCNFDICEIFIYLQTGSVINIDYIPKRRDSLVNNEGNT